MGGGPGPSADGDAGAVDVLGDGAAEEPARPPESPYDRPGQWYVVHTYAGYENKVKSNLESRISSMNMEDRIFEVVIPMEDVVELKNGKRQVVSTQGLPRLPDGPHGPRRRLLVRGPQHPGRDRLRGPGRPAHPAVAP